MLRIEVCSKHIKEGLDDMLVPDAKIIPIPYFKKCPFCELPTMAEYILEHDNWD